MKMEKIPKESRYPGTKFKIPRNKRVEENA